MKRKIKKSTIYFILFIGILMAISFMLVFTRQMTIPFFFHYKEGRCWTIATSQSDSPFTIDTAGIRVLHWEKYDNRCKLMADPFIVQDGNDYYIFYEEGSNKNNATGADIAVLQSSDLENWKRIGVALDEYFHLSFPNVFKYNGDWYMIPETHKVSSVRLYKAVDFPLKWKYEKSLIFTPNPSDPAIVQWKGFWYIMFSSPQGLLLYYSDDLYGEWIQHTASPIHKKCGNQETRPAGTFINYKDSLYYVVQRHDGGYGTSTIAYRVDSLSPTSFIDYRLPNNPIIEKHGNGWAKDGMHQLSCIYLPEKDQYFCVMDGASWQKDVKGWDWQNLPKLVLMR